MSSEKTNLNWLAWGLIWVLLIGMIVLFLSKDNTFTIIGIEKTYNNFSDTDTAKGFHSECVEWDVKEEYTFTYPEQINASFFSSSFECPNKFFCAEVNYYVIRGLNKTSCVQFDARYYTTVKHLETIKYYESIIFATASSKAYCQEGNDDIYLQDLPTMNKGLPIVYVSYINETRIVQDKSKCVKETLVRDLQ